MKFDVVVGNPPYQVKSQGTSKRDEPVYHLFYNLAEDISSEYCLISPARFLFNAGSTPRNWNEKMLNDRHTKVLKYEQLSNKLFPNTDIKGGVVIIYRNNNVNFEPIKVFTAFPQLNTLFNRVIQTKNFKSIDAIVTNRGSYRYSKEAYDIIPSIMVKTSDPRIASNAFDKLPELFFDEKPHDGSEYIRILGRQNGQRLFKWFKRQYLLEPDNFTKYKVILPKANGSGAIGEVLSTPLIGTPLIGYIETFISIGNFESLEEAENCLKYIKTKFSRSLLGVLKITQENTRKTWRYVPIQDFTLTSDIDWTKSVHEIDQQLYKKYGLNQEEINFIEEKVKSMD